MTFALFLLALLIQLPGCEAATERTLVCEREGQAFSVIFPAGYERSRSWPVILILHGDGRNHRTLIDNPATMSTLLRSNSVIILPDGGRTWWRDEGRILGVLEWLSPRLNLDSLRVACGGWSMGGYGSLHMVTAHPERFIAWGGMIGLVDYPNARYPASENYPVPALFGEPATWPAANPMQQADRLRGKAIWFATGDQAFDAAMNRELDRILSSKQIAHTFEVIRGKHDFAEVSELLPHLLDFFDRALQSRE